MVVIGRAFLCLNQCGEFNFGLLTATHQAALSLILFSMTGQGNMGSLVCQDKDREFTHQLLSGAKQTKTGKDFLSLLPINNRVG